MAENLLSDSMQFAKVTDKLQNNYIVLKSIRICYGAKACRKENKQGPAKDHIFPLTFSCKL